MTRAATYLRVSTEDQAERYGLAAQRHALEAALVARRYTFVREYVDEGVSGATERRAHLDQCLADARVRQFDVLLTYDSSRLARDGRLWTNLVHDFGLASVRVEYLTLPPDETPVGEFMRWIMAGVGQLERATIRERTHAGRLAKARSGRFVTGRWPYGYRYVAGVLEADPAAALVVRELFEAVGNEGLSLRGLARRLQERGLCSPRGRHWRPTTLHRILANPAYRGAAVYNRRRFARVEGRRSPRVTRKPEAEWITIPVPALVPEELWQRVQARLAAAVGGRPAQTVYLLSGRLRCGVCGRKLHGGPTRTGPYYRCASVDWVAVGARQRCALKMQHAPRLEGRVWAALVAAFRDPRALVPHLEKRATRRAVADIETQSARVQLRGAVARVERQIGRVLELLVDETLPQAELRTKLASLESERRLLAERLARVEGALAAQAHNAAQATSQETQVRNWLGTLPRRLEALTAPARAALIRACLDEIVVHRDGTLTLTGVLSLGTPVEALTAPTVEPSPGCRSSR